MLETLDSVQKQYQSTMDSVNLINSDKPEFMSEEQWNDTIRINKEHISIMLNKDFWTDEDLTPLKDALK